ncbi:MAG: hypothetical protein AB8D78_11615 [Akkermansiaceae bacterium]
MEQLAGPIGGPELIIIAILLIIFGIWTFLSFLPNKATLAASALLVSFSIQPAPIEKTPVPQIEAMQETRFI